MRPVIEGLENPTDEEWSAWHRRISKERLAVRWDARTDWSDTTFRQLFLFLYDTSLYDGRWQIEKQVARWRAWFGRVDEVLLWHAYPRLGFDERTQFDFYRGMPGGLAGLRAEVSDVLHAHGIRVFVDYNPWDKGSYDELAEIARAIDADGVMLDTMASAPDELARALDPRLVLAPELAPKDEDLRVVRQSWAQWFDVGAGPSIYRHAFIARPHRQFAIARWDTSRKKDIVYSFFNGAGLVLWENIFGSWNPYSRADRRLIAETAAIFDSYEELFARGQWLPLVPTGVKGLDANRWTDGRRTLTTFRNRTDSTLHFRVEQACTAFWGDAHDIAPGKTVAIEPGGTQAIVEGEDARGALEHFRELSARADVDRPEDERSPPARQIGPVSPPRRSSGMIALAGGHFEMIVRHERRECGCYDEPWGWFYKDVIEHRIRVAIDPFEMKATAVTNAELLAFVHASGYRPADERCFLQHIARDANGNLPKTLSPEQAALPVTWVSLADARAYAAAVGQRLPTEAEWQWAAEGAGRGHVWPWGNEEKSFPARLRAANDHETSTPQGIRGLSANAWELTESEHTDGHTRFVMLRGGIYLPPGESEWLPSRGPRPNGWHAKYILLADGLDRSATISFRTVGSVR